MAEQQTAADGGIGDETIADLLEYVDNDPIRAVEVLDLERQRGRDARSTLVEKLEEIAHPTRTEGEQRPPLAEVAVESYNRNQARAESPFGATKEA